MTRPAVPAPSFTAKDVVVTPKVIDAIRAGEVKGWVPVVDMEPDGKGGLNPVPKLTPWWNDPIWQNRDTGEWGWNPLHQPHVELEPKEEIEGVRWGGLKRNSTQREFVSPPTFNRRIEKARAQKPERTSARKKLEWITKQLRAQARQFTDPATGVVRWPASVQRDLDAAAWKLGRPGNLSVEEQVDLLARNYIVFSANKQKENDQKRITTDWHGHSVA